MLIKTPKRLANGLKKFSLKDRITQLKTTQQFLSAVHTKWLWSAILQTQIIEKTITYFAT